MPTVYPAAAGKKQHQIDGTQLAKTRLCLFYQEGRCKYGTECTYAHNVEEVRKAPEELRKTKFCELFMDASRGCVDPDCNFAHDSAELRSKKDARRKARASLRITPSGNLNAPRLSQVSTNALELMQQLAALLAAVQQESPVLAPSTVAQLAPTVHKPASDCSASSSSSASLFTCFDFTPEVEQLTGLSELLGPREPLSPSHGLKRPSLASTSSSTPLATPSPTRSSFSLF